MENWKELLYQSISTIIFCVAITLLLHQSASYSKLLEQIKCKDEPLIYQQPWDKDEPLVTYAELIASLVQPLEYDMEIDGLLISKYDHTVDQIESYDIKNTKYRKTYAYDSNAVVTRIIYKSVNTE